MDKKIEYTYFDTSAYRWISQSILNGLEANEGSWDKLNSFQSRLIEAETKKGIEIKVSYLTLTELMLNLKRPTDSKHYIQSKYALKLALAHTKYKKENMLYNFDNEILLAGGEEISHSSRERELSLYTFLLWLNENQFDDKVIKESLDKIKEAEKYVKSLKEMWLNIFTYGLIQNDQQSTFKHWQIYFDNEEARKSLLIKIRNEKGRKEILSGFARSIKKYAESNLQTHFKNAEVADVFLNRFNPIFGLQLRIIEQMCQIGYNLENHNNDIIDYLMAASLNPEKSLFVSNETDKLLPYLIKLGYSESVSSIESYCDGLAIKI